MPAPRKRRKGAAKESNRKKGRKGAAEAAKEKDRRGPRMPKELQGQRAARGDGEPICFGFNLETCQAVSPGAKCSNGGHICCRPGCGKPHPFKQCS